MTRLPSIRALLLFLLLILTAQAGWAKGGMVTAADPQAAEAGRAMLRQGGSATDAALAMMLALTVVEPQSSGIGGGGFFLHHDGKTGRIESIDGREEAPSAATADRFLGPDGTPMPFASAYPGGKSVGVPGNVALLAMAHGRWGHLPWAALFQPAIALAEQGFTVGPLLHARLMTMADLWRDFPEIRALYLPNGAVPETGARLTNPALGAFLRRLAAEGPDAFYRGSNAVAIAAAIGHAPTNPARLTEADIAAYRAAPRPALCGRYRRYRICSMGPPSSGAVAMLQILGMLERFDLKRLGPDSPRAWHLIAEAMQLAYADRDTWLGDPDHVQVPVAGLIDRAYIRTRARLIDPAHARADYPPGKPHGAGMQRHFTPSGEVPSTTHFIAIDGNGDIAGMTSTVEGPFGSQLIVNGYVLNNELTDFSFAPERNGAPAANRVGPGKRPLSSMAPTIVYDARGRPVFTVGAAGGRTIIMQVVKALIAHFDWGMDARAAIARGLVFFGKDGLILEQGAGLEALKAPLEAMGHRVVVAPLSLKANAAERIGNHWRGAADPRSAGIALDE